MQVDEIAGHVDGRELALAIGHGAIARGKSADEQGGTRRPVAFAHKVGAGSGFLDGADTIDKRLALG